MSNSNKITPSDDPYRRFSYQQTDRPLSSLVSQNLRYKVAQAYPVMDATKNYAGENYSLRGERKGYQTIAPSASERNNNEMSHSILTADIICSYFTKESPQQLNGVIAQIRGNPTTQLFGAAFGFAVTFLIYKFVITSDWGIDFFSPFTVAYAYPMLLPVVGSLGAFGKASYDNYRSKLGAQTIVKDYTKQQQEESAIRAKQLQPGNAQLRTECLDIYKALCTKYHGNRCKSKTDPFQSREDFFNFFKDNGASMRRYANLPRTLFEDMSKNLSLANFENTVKIRVNEWINALWELEHVADEAGIMMLLMYGAMVASGKLLDYRPIFEHHINNGFNLIYTKMSNLAQEMKYRKIFKSCSIALILARDALAGDDRVTDDTFTDGFMNFILRCAHPPRDMLEEDKHAMVLLQHDIWEEIEIKVGATEGEIHENLKRRPSFDQYITGDLMDTDDDDDDDDDDDVDDVSDEAERRRRAEAVEKRIRAKRPRTASPTSGEPPSKVPRNVKDKELSRRMKEIREKEARRRWKSDFQDMVDAATNGDSTRAVVPYINTALTKTRYSPTASPEVTEPITPPLRQSPRLNLHIEAPISDGSLRFQELSPSPVLTKAKPKAKRVSKAKKRTEPYPTQSNSDESSGEKTRKSPRRAPAKKKDKTGGGGGGYLVGGTTRGVYRGYF